MAGDRRHFHFVGICGTAMGSVAAAMKRRGLGVSGSDAQVYPPMSTFLEGEGIALHEGYSGANIPPETDVVIIGNAISRGNEEAECVLERKLLYQSLPEVLKTEFLCGRRNLVVTGTHGKTTTTSLLAWILESAGRDPSFMIGGIPRNFGCGARFTGSPWVVLEGDEYDCAFFDKRSKFLHYLPEVAIINNVEFDHADIYGSLAEIQLSFRRLVNIVPRNGLILVNADDPAALEVVAASPAPVRRVGFGEEADLRIAELELLPGRARFRLGEEAYLVPLDGEFNVRNAAMAAAAARWAGVTEEQVRTALAEFRGVARRQELRGERRGVRVVDDFGHHPTAIAATLRAMRQRYPEGALWALFEPRSNTSQRRIFQEELPRALAEADGVLIAPLHRPDKVASADRLDVPAVVEALRSLGRQAWVEDGAAAMLERLRPLVQAGDTIVVLSNGGFDNVHEKLLAQL